LAARCPICLQEPDSHRKISGVHLPGADPELQVATVRSRATFWLSYTYNGKRNGKRP